MGVMARGNPTWGKSEPVNWRFRVRGKSPDGRMVTLGKFHEETLAKVRCDELVEEGAYRNLRVQRLTPKPAA